MPVAQLRMDALAFACPLNRHFDIEVILHITMRDMSLLGLQSQLLGASALGYQNFLVMTGDAAKHSDIEGTKGFSSQLHGSIKTYETNESWT